MKIIHWEVFMYSRTFILNIIKLVEDFNNIRVMYQHLNYDYYTLYKTTMNRESDTMENHWYNVIFHILFFYFKHQIQLGIRA